jgi:hypothetical protein
MSRVGLYRCVVMAESQRRHDTELLHQVEQRCDAPVLGDLAVDNPHGIVGLETDLLTGSWDTEELSLVAHSFRSLDERSTAFRRSRCYTAPAICARSFA